MKIYLIPSNLNFRPSSLSSMSHAILQRKDESPRIIMSNVSSHDGDSKLRINGDPVNGFSLSDLRDGDTIIYPSNNYREDAYSVSVEVSGNILLPTPVEESLSSIVSGLEIQSNFVLSLGKRAKDLMEKADKVLTATQLLYDDYPMYKNIMMKENGEIKPYSLVQLIANQESTIQQALETYLLTMSSSLLSKNYRNTMAKKILSEVPYDEYFQLLTEEEQVGHFIEFSKLSSAQKQEYVPDTLINAIRNSDEYQSTLESMSVNGLGESETQQFNVLQQIGYFSDSHGERNILYNLSDMGAGKTLMTVQAIKALDLKQVSTWLQSEESEQWTAFSVPDKHIITPTLSVKSSWIDTFSIFYDVTKVDDYTYELSFEYEGMTVTSMIYVSPFTIKNSLTYVNAKLPIALQHTYLIIDEIHQLVKKPISKTKFFPSNTVPATLYKTFILSGTMSNLLTQEWYNYMRFMGMTISDSTAQMAKNAIESDQLSMASAISTAVDSIRVNHRRQIDTDSFTHESLYDIKTDMKKMTSIEEEFYTKYGVQMMTKPYLPDGAEITFEQYLEKMNGGQVQLQTNPNESDTTNFKLFYDIVGAQSITAQSTVIAEELFGDQQTQHISDIIKTSSPLTPEDIKILKVLHHIAEDHGHYKSLKIAKDINTAILNLNDGLQTKSIYDIISSAAERNIRFFTYLAQLDVNILEKLPQSNLITLPTLEETEKFQILQDILKREKDETHLIVVNDYHAMVTLSKALDIIPITKAQLRDELSYQDTLDELFEKQSIVVVTQDMIKSSLDLVQANRLVQYQLNTEISDIIQTQNRINRIGQTRETRGYYIASDALQENLIELFLTSYRNIRVAHKGIVELFVDVTSQINIVNDYLAKALDSLSVDDEAIVEDTVESSVDVVDINSVPEGQELVLDNDISDAILYPQDGKVLVLVPLSDGSPFTIGTLTPEKVEQFGVTAPIASKLNISTLEVTL